MRKKPIESTHKHDNFCHLLGQIDRKLLSGVSNEADEEQQQQEHQQNRIYDANIDALVLTLKPLSLCACKTQIKKKGKQNISIG